MNVEQFLSHHGIRENPFNAEEARHDPVFQRMEHAEIAHPEFAKILGDLNRPSTSVVFGEKGSGKTAIRLMIDAYVKKHNLAAGSKPEAGKLLLVPYDDLNPILDRFLQHKGKRKHDEPLTEAQIERQLAAFRLADHQDAILSLAVTRLINGLLNETPASSSQARMALPDQPLKLLKKQSRQVRVNMAVLAALYDQPDGGSAVDRFRRIKGKLRLGIRWGALLMKCSTLLAGLGTVAIAVAQLVKPEEEQPAWLVPGFWVLLGVTVLLALLWMYRKMSLGWLGRKIVHGMPAIGRDRASMTAMLNRLRRTDLASQPWPINNAGSDPRYDLTRRLIDVLGVFGFTGLIILVDRVDEPTVVAGHPGRMKAFIWPMFDNKFLQQPNVGMKLLLPLELRYLMHRESSNFFQEARLDKQNLVDRLAWSGANLYDLCNARLRACLSDGRTEPLVLTDLFAEDVSRMALIDALDQMQQPRDAFKFLYAVVQEHCRGVSAEESSFRIAKLTLETVRRQQAQRVQELHQGLAPA